MTDKERQLYELMHKEGKRRFGSPCEHRNTKNGYCINCLRKIVS